MFRSTRIGFFASIVGLAGCLGSESPGCSPLDPNGLTGNGTFNYDCIGDGDPECDDGAAFSLGGDLPARPIARGAEFRLTYSGANGTTLEPVSTAAVLGRERFKALRAGTVGFFVETSDPNDGDTIDDALRLEVVEPARIGIERRPPVAFGSASVLVGVSIPFRAVAFDAKGERLAGAMPITWTVDKPWIAEVDSVTGSAPGTCELTGVAPGRVRLQASVGGLLDEITVDVTTFGARPDAGLDASDASDASNDVATTNDAEAGDASLD